MPLLKINLLLLKIEETADFTYFLYLKLIGFKETSVIVEATAGFTTCSFISFRNKLIFIILSITLLKLISNKEIVGFIKETAGFNTYSFIYL